MAGAIRTPGANVAANVAVLMQWRGLTHDELAERVTRIGIGSERESGERMGWHRRTVNRVLAGKRRLSVDDLYALALALNTTVAVLLLPDIAIEDDDAGDEYAIGDLPPINREAFERLAQTPKQSLLRSRLALSGWDDPNRELTWELLPSAVDEALRVAEREYLAAHPTVSRDQMRTGDVLRWLDEQAGSP